MAKIKMKETTLNNIKRGAVCLGIGFIAGVSAPTAVVSYVGNKAIFEEYNKVSDNYGITYHPSKEDAETVKEKYVINHGSTYIEFDEAVNSIIDECRDIGMTDTEIAIGLRESFKENKYLITDYIDTTISERMDMRKEKCFEKQLTKKK